MLIQILSPGFTTPNGRAFLFPLVVWRRQLRQRGMEIRVVGRIEELGDSDAIVVDSKFHRDRWDTDLAGILKDFADLRTRTDLLIYSDTTDSSGWLQTELLPLVDRYWKFQLLRNREEYLRPMYGHRIYADHYHRTQRVDDAEPAWSTAVADPGDLAKLATAWNSGLADYSLYGPYRMAAYQRLPLPGLLCFPRTLADPSPSRGIAVSCRFGASYLRESVAWQRKAIRQILGARMATDKLSRRAYLSELRNSRLTVSPFGFGEITLKDFEVFLAGSLLIKPDMTHLETWPDLFRHDQTMLAHSWDLDDLESVIDAALGDPARAENIARTGQSHYQRHIAPDTGPDLFAEHLAGLLTKITPSAAA